MCLNLVNTEIDSVLQILKSSKIAKDKYEDIEKSLLKVKNSVKTELNKTKLNLKVSPVNNQVKTPINSNKSLINNSTVSQTSNIDNSISVENEGEVTQILEKSKFSNLTAEEKFDHIFEKLLDIETKTQNSTQTLKSNQTKFKTEKPFRKQNYRRNDYFRPKSNYNWKQQYYPEERQSYRSYPYHQNRPYRTYRQNWRNGLTNSHFDNNQRNLYNDRYFTHTYPQNTNQSNVLPYYVIPQNYNPTSNNTF